MKKINSIGYGHKIIGLAELFLMVIPFFCHILYSSLHTVIFTVLMYTSLAIGFLVLISFIVLLNVEFHQDKKIDRQYIHIKKMKLPLANGFYECQSCGNRQVYGTEKNCGICGIKFTTERNGD